MKKLFILSLMVLFSTQAVIAQDMELPGEKWIAKFNKYVCSNTGVAVDAPKAFTDLNVAFEQITTDSTLDNGLLKATFTVEGKTCRYNALMFADNAAYTIRLVESKAYSLEEANCTDGKALLDAALESNSYLYYGRPHNIAIMVSVDGATEVCNGSSAVGINFVVAGRVNK